MKQIQSTISSKNQIVVPAEIRRKLKLKTGDKLMWRVIETGDSYSVVTEPYPKSWALYTKGLGKSIWSTTNLEKYITNLRAEWSNQS